jgi:hypothetical protein
MALQLVNSAVVVAARHFNPSVTSQIWLIDNGIILREEFKSGSGAVFTDMFVQVPTDKFHLLIVPDNCQFTPAPNVERQQELISKRVGRLVEILPHTPYQAVGLNFWWHLVPENDTVDAVCRRLFFFAESPLHRLFDVDNARFGSYLSKDSLGGRLKVNVQPVMIPMPDGQVSHLIQFAFNYHFDVAGRQNPVAEIQQTLNRWNEAREESAHIVETTTGGQML